MRRVKCNGARQRSHVRMSRYAQNLSRATRTANDSARRIIPLPPVAGSFPSAEVFVTSTCLLEQPPEPAPVRLSLRERAAASIAKMVAETTVVKNWSIGVHPLALTEPEALVARGIDPDALCVYGWVGEGTYFRSSPIVKVAKIRGEIVVHTVNGHRYRLGDHNPDFQAWCREHNFALPTVEHRWQR